MQYICCSISLLPMHTFKKRIFFILSSFIILLLISCNKTNSSEEITEQKTSVSEFKVSEKDIKSITYTEFALSNLSETATNDWFKFQELQEKIAQLKKGDLTFFKEEKVILQRFFKDLIIEMPESLNITPILVRVSVLETTVYKLQGIINLKNIRNELLLIAIKDVLVSNSNIILQLNKKLEKESQAIQNPN